MTWFAVKISDAVLLKQFSGIVIIWLVIQTNRTKKSGMSKFATQVFHYIGTFSFQLMIRIPRVTIHAGDGLLGAVIWLLLKGKSWFCSYLVMVVKCICTDDLSYIGAGEGGWKAQWWNLWGEGLERERKGWREGRVEKLGSFGLWKIIQIYNWLNLVWKQILRSDLCVYCKTK